MNGSILEYIEISLTKLNLNTPKILNAKGKNLSIENKHKYNFM